MNPTIDPTTIVSLHKESILRWKSSEVTYCQQNFLALVEENHAFNYLLWHAEDRARRDDMGYEFVYRAKREIDHYNQQRNNRMEAMDEWLFNYLMPADSASCPVHSETPGMMIDRLSILALKAYHMELQVYRQDADEQHRERCRDKLDVINQQQRQLEDCLINLMSDSIEKKRTFRVYHQFKMYNDPTLNPEIYTLRK